MTLKALDLSRRLYQRTKDVESYTLLSGTQRLIDYLMSEEPESSINASVTSYCRNEKGLSLLVST